MKYYSLIVYANLLSLWLGYAVKKIRLNLEIFIKLRLSLNISG